jgi:hypothetical protein
MWMATAAASKAKVKKSAAARYVTTYPLDYPQAYNAAPRRLIHISLKEQDVHVLFVTVKP